MTMKGIHDLLDNDVNLYLLQHALDQWVTESEGSCGEWVEDGGVDLGVVLVVVTVADREDVQLRHVVGAEDDGQPLVVGDVLVLCDHNLPRLLVQSLIVPVRVEIVEFLTNERTVLVWSTNEKRVFTLASLLCSLTQTVWNTVSPGCSLTRLSPETSSTIMIPFCF